MAAAVAAIAVGAHAAVGDDDPRHQTRIYSPWTVAFDVAPFDSSCR